MRWQPRLGQAICTLAVAACGGSDSGTGPATPQVAHVTIAPSPDSLHIGEAIQLVATPTTSGGDPVSGLPVAWQVSNASIATLTQGGVLTGVAVGTVTVEATIADHADTISVVVKLVPVASVALNVGGDTLAMTQTVTLVPTALDAAGHPLSGRLFTYSTSDGGTATVSSGGLVTATGLGTADITVSSGAASTTARILVPSCGPSVSVWVNSWALAIRSGGVLTPAGLAAATQYKTTGALYGAGLVIGTAAGQTLTGYEPESAASDFVSGPVCTLLNSAPSHTYAKLTVSPDLKATQETFAFSDAANVGYVLFRYSVTNVSNAALPAVVVGFVGDWDLAFDNWAGDDIVRRSPGLTAGEALEGDSVAYPQVMGLVSIAQTGTFGYDGWTNGSVRTRTDFYNALTSGTPPATAARGDVRQLVGRGALTLAPGQHRTSYFAIVGGDTRAQFNANVAAATARANLLGFP
jgi:hypothetical protein